MQTVRGRFLPLPILHGVFALRLVLLGSAAVAFAPIAHSAPPWASGPSITTTSPLPGALTYTAYSVTLSAKGGKTPYRWATTTSLPPGLFLSTAGVLSGTPTVAATFAISVVVVDAKNKSAVENFVLVVTAPASLPPLTINPASLPSGTVGRPYSYHIPVEGGTPPYRCTPDANNNLSAFGLTLSDDCWLRGTPIRPGQVIF